MATFAPYSSWTRKLFNSYLKWNFKKHFSHLYCCNLNALYEVTGPLLFVANHVSWWDGFFLFELQRRLRPKAQLYTVALEQTCRANPILEKMGVLPLNPGSPSSLKALLGHIKKLRQTLSPEELMLTFFPQGKISPSFKATLEFQRGVEWIAEALSPVTVVPVGIHIEPMTAKTPTAVLSLGKPFLWDETSEAKLIESQVREALNIIHQQLARNGEILSEPFEQWSL